MNQVPLLPATEICRFSSFFDKLPHKFGGWNSGMIYHNNQFLFSCRNETSRFREGYFGSKTPQEVRWQRSVPALIKLDINGNFLEVKDSITVPNESLEDVRLFKWNGEIYCTGSKRVGKGVDQFLAKLIDNIVYLLPFNHNFRLNQKNWNPIVHNNELYFEQSMTSPRTILKYDVGGNLKTISEKHFGFELRGNSPPIPFNDKLLTFYHTYHGDHHFLKRVYVQYAALIEPEPPFDIIKLYGPFKFLPANYCRIQFHIGLDIIGDDIFFSYGIEDSDNIFAKISKKSFIQFLENFI